AELYKKYKAGIATVLSENGHGSGFLVDQRGLVLTNHHVISGSSYNTVRFARGKRYEATVIADDPAADVAVLAIHPDIAGPLPVLPLAVPKDGLLAVEGERVF